MVTLDVFPCFISLLDDLLLDDLLASVYEIPERKEVDIGGQNWICDWRAGGVLVVKREEREEIVC